MKSRGLGDSVKKITELVGIDSLAEIAANVLNYKDCGCDKRQAWLNRQFPYKETKIKDGNKY